MSQVLIIDGILRDRDRISSFLDQHKVLVSSSWAEAQSCLQREGNSFDVAILSWELEGPPSGPDVLKLLRRQYPNVAVIVTSGRMDWSVVERAFKVGAKDTILKPLERFRVQDAVIAVATPDPNSGLSPLNTEFVGNSEAILKPLQTLARAIQNSDEPILLVGETGTGKEVLARAVNFSKEAKPSPWIALNIGGVKPEFVESELFGHEKGAFTGADRQHMGVFERCGNGTLFLDEIGELELSLQIKLLRAIQEKEFSRLGGEKTLQFKGRLVLATNRNLNHEVEESRFRRDLFHRISTHEIRLPPLRERGDDLWMLIEHFLECFDEGRKVTLARETKQLLSSYDFPGNVRELENIVRHGLSECLGNKLLPSHLPLQSMQERRGDVEDVIELPADWKYLPHKDAVRKIEAIFNSRYLLWIYEQSGENVTKAAKRAEMDRKTFRSKWKDAGLGDF